MQLSIPALINSIYFLTINPIELGKSINLGISLNVIIVILLLIIMIFLGSSLFSQKK